MKLIAHNFLSSSFLKGVSEGYPLLLTATKKEINEHEFNEAFVERMMKKIDYGVLRNAAIAIGEGRNLPTNVPPNVDLTNYKWLLKELHHVLVCVEVIEGTLQCPESGRIFPISDGIPNMLAEPDEIK